MTTTQLILLLQQHEKGKYSNRPFQLEIFDRRRGEGRNGLILSMHHTLEFSSSGDSIGDPRLFLEIGEEK
jgi:hypothetical protein